MNCESNISPALKYLQRRLRQPLRDVLEIADCAKERKTTHNDQRRQSDRTMRVGVRHTGFFLIQMSLPDL